MDGKTCGCGMPLNAKTVCTCNNEVCIHCCECGEGCTECRCGEKAAEAEQEPENEEE